MDITLLDRIGPLQSGAHGSEVPETGKISACVMEAVALVAGEPWSDHPACACPVSGAFLRSLNDILPDDRRDALLRPLVLRLVGSRSTPEVEIKRGFIFADFAVRIAASAALRKAGLDAEADKLAALPEITSAYAADAAVDAAAHAAHAAHAAYAAYAADAAARAARAADAADAAARAADAAAHAAYAAYAAYAARAARAARAAARAADAAAYAADADIQALMDRVLGA